VKRSILPVLLLVLGAATTPPSSAQEARSAPAPPPLRPFYDYPFGPPTASERTLSIEDAIAAALGQTSPYRQALIEERSAGEGVRQARATFLPQVTAPLTYFGTTHAYGTGPGVPSFAPSIGVNETTAVVAAGGALDVSGGLRAASRRAHDALAAARAGTATARRDLVLATVDAYYGLALARQKRRLADETLAIAEGFAEITAEQAAAGDSAEAELHRSRAEALKRRDELQQARVAESAGADVLRTLTGIDPSIYVAVARLGPELPPLAGFGQYKEEDIVDARPQLRQIDALAQTAVDEERAARAERRPQLAYAVSAGFDAIDLGQLRRYSGGSAVVSLRIPVFDFGASRSREVQAGLRREEFEVLRATTKRALEQEFYTARAAAFSARERRASAQERAEESEKSLKLLTNRYRRRKATITEVVDAQSAYADARTAYYQAIADLSTARVRLEADPSQAVFTPVAVAAAPPPPPVALCDASPERAPELAGLRLGMTVDEVRRAFPTVEGVRAKKNGIVNVKLEEDDLARLPPPADPRFKPSKAALRFFDDHLYYFRVSYYGSTWSSLGDFLTRTAAQMAVDGSWKAFYDWELKTLRDAEDLSDMALECRGFRIRVGLGIEGVAGEQKPHVKIEDTAVLQRLRLREAEEARKEAEDQAAASENK
jgi:outer membrane protein TolC